MFRLSILLIFISCFFISCKNYRSDKKEDRSSGIKVNIKAPATFHDTLNITMPAAVFYHPDSVQLKKIKTQTDSMVFDGNMHEYFYQMRNARMVIRKNWPKFGIIESKNYRFICFQPLDNSRVCIDLNTKKDVYGLFIYDGKKKPVMVDMTNIETEISFYLKGISK